MNRENQVRNAGNMPLAGTTLVASDEDLLERARMHWQLGEWESLKRLSRNAIQNHPDRAKLALLVGAGHLQSGRLKDARRYLELAATWGCERQVIKQLIVSAIHNSLGCAAAAGGLNPAAERHFAAAIAVAAPQTDATCLGRSRHLREAVRLGLLPDAARLLGDELSDVKHRAPVDTARLGRLETQLELLNHELALAQQRHQLLSRPGALPENSSDKLTLKRRSFSQLGQDVWVLERLDYKRNGYFVEFGATDGVLLSNTWLLEKEFGWSGICVEPNPRFFEQLKGNRGCTVSPACIGGETGREVEFILADVYGGIVDYADDDKHKDKRALYRDQCVKFTTISLADLLVKHDAPRRIDYMSIDTEGSEFEIINAFPFDEWDVRLMTVEHNYSPRRADIRKCLERFGYRCTEQHFEDWYEKLEGGPH